MTTGGGVWVQYHASQPCARGRVFCFPYAGGGAQLFRTWQARLGGEIEVCPVQLPGRWTRRNEPLATRVGPLVEALAVGIEPYLDTEFVLYGHSLGSLIAYELCRNLRRRGRPLPALLAVGSRRAPDLSVPHATLHALPEAEFVGEICRRYGGIPEAVLREPDLLQLLIPVLRADMEMFETYEFKDEPPLSCPVLALRGESDPATTNENMEAWGNHTDGEFELCVLPGGHFFFADAPDAFFDRFAEVAGRMFARRDAVRQGG